MLGVCLLFVGIVLINNGMCTLYNVDGKSTAVMNIFTGGLSLFINFVNLVQGNYYAAGTGLLFCFTYLFVAFSRILKLRLDDGRIDCLDGKGEANATEMLNIYTLLGYVKENASFMDKWVPFADLRDARPFGPAYKIGVTDVFAATFSGHAKELREAFLKLNGTELPQGDVGYQINAFECEPMRFYFWDCDDEFEAQGNILFDYSATDFNHVESAVSTAEMGVKRLAELAGLPLRGKSFGMQ